MKPTQEQLNDPVWWSNNVSDEYDYAFTTGPEWNGGETLIGTVKFGDEAGDTSAGELAIGDVAWVPLAKRPTKPVFVPEVGEDSLLPEVGSKVGIYLASLGNILIPHVVKGYKVWRSTDKNNDHYRVFILLGPSEDNRSGDNERPLNDVFPIKSEREETVNKALEIYNCGKYSIDMAEALYDAGMLRLKESIK